MPSIHRLHLRPTRLQHREQRTISLRSIKRPRPCIGDGHAASLWLFEHHGQNVTSKGNNGANVVQSHHVITRLNPPYCCAERPTTHHQDKINTWTTAPAFESVVTGRLLNAITLSFVDHAGASPMAGRSRRLIISHASLRGHDEPAPLRAPLLPFALPAVACAAASVAPLVCHA